MPPCATSSSAIHSRSRSSGLRGPTTWPGCWRTPGRTCGAIRPARTAGRRCGLPGWTRPVSASSPPRMAWRCRSCLGGSPRWRRSMSGWRAAARSTGRPTRLGSARRRRRDDHADCGGRARPPGAHGRAGRAGWVPGGAGQRVDQAVHRPVDDLHGGGAGRADAGDRGVRRADREPAAGRHGARRQPDRRHGRAAGGRGARRARGVPGVRHRAGPDHAGGLPAPVHRARGQGDAGGGRDVRRRSGRVHPGVRHRCRAVGRRRAPAGRTGAGRPGRRAEHRAGRHVGRGVRRDPAVRSRGDQHGLRNHAGAAAARPTLRRLAGLGRRCHASGGGAEAGPVLGCLRGRRRQPRRLAVAGTRRRAGRRRAGRRRLAAADTGRLTGRRPRGAGRRRSRGRVTMASVTTRAVHTAAAGLRALRADLAPSARALVLPLRLPRWPWMAWLPQVLLGLAAVVLAGAGWHVLYTDFAVPNRLAAALGIAAALPVAVCLQVPMLGWWTSLGLTVATAAVVRSDGGGPLWPDPTLYVYLVVLGLVGLRVRLRVLVEIWLLTLLASRLVLRIAPGRA